MPRPLLYRNSELAYHLTARSNNKEWFYISTERCWDIVRGALFSACERYGVFLHVAVLMSNHLHMIASTPRANIDDFMQYFLSQATRFIQYDANRINHVFGSRYKWSFLDSPWALAYAYKYALRNPVRAGMCSSVSDYKFSSLNDNRLPLVEGFDHYWKLVPKEQELKLNWLDMPVEREAEDLIRRALRRHRFQFTKDNTFRSRLRGLHSSYGVIP